MSTKTLISADDFLKLADELGPCELVRGEVVKLSPAGFDHSRITAFITHALVDWTRRSKRGRVLGGEAGVITGSEPDTVRGADVAYISYARLPSGRRRPGFLRVAPELVVEVLGRDRTWRDLVEKTGEYLALGVDRVWIVDPEQRTVHIFRPDAPPMVVAEDGTLADPDVLPESQLAVRELFED